MSQRHGPAFVFGFLAADVMSAYIKWPLETTEPLSNANSFY